MKLVKILLIWISILNITIQIQDYSRDWIYFLSFYPFLVTIDDFDTFTPMDLYKWCICGPSTDKLGKGSPYKEGYTIEMYKLAQNDFSFNSAREEFVNTQGYGNGYIMKEMTSSTIWYNVLDYGFLTYEYQMEQLKTTLTGMAKVLNVTGGEITVGECRKTIYALDPSLKQILVAIDENEDLKNKFIEELKSHGIDNIYRYPQENEEDKNEDSKDELDENDEEILKKKYDEDDEPKKSNPHYYAFDIPGDEEILGMYDLPDIEDEEKKKELVEELVLKIIENIEFNMIQCDIEGTYNNLVEEEEITFNKTIAFVEGNVHKARRKLFIVFNNPVEIEDLIEMENLSYRIKSAIEEGIKEIDEDEENEEPYRIENIMDISKETITSLNAYIPPLALAEIKKIAFDKSIDEETAKSEIAEITKKYVSLPNSFENLFCNSIFAEKSLIKMFDLVTEPDLYNNVELSANGTKIYSNYRNKCPMISWRGKIWKTDVEEGNEGNFEAEGKDFNPMFYEINNKLLEPEKIEDSEEIMNEIQKYIFDKPKLVAVKEDVSEYKFEYKDDWENCFEEFEEQANEFEEEIHNLDEKESEILSDKKSATVSEFEKLNEEISARSLNSSSKDEVVEDDKPEDENTHIEKESSEIMDEVNQEPNNETIDNEQAEEEERLCNEAKDAIGDRYRDKKPTNLFEAELFMKEFIKTPQLVEGCKGEEIEIANSKIMHDGQYIMSYDIEEICEIPNPEAQQKIKEDTQADNLEDGQTIGGALNMQRMTLLQYNELQNQVSADEEDSEKSPFEDCLKKSFRYTFSNKAYQNPKIEMFYVPAREVVNEWDAFARIYNNFDDFVKTEGSNSHTIHTMFDNIFSYVETQALNDSSLDGQWDIKLKTIESSLGDLYPEKLKETMSKSDSYIFYLVEARQSLKFHDLIYESWYMGDYIYIRLRGTLMDYQVMIHKNSNDDKLDKLNEAMFKNIAESYLREDSIISLYELKKLIFDSMKAASKNKKLHFSEQIVSNGQEDQSRDAVQENINSIESSSNEFLYSVYCESLENSYFVYGFIHGNENIPLVNLFFTSGFFNAEYLIPITNKTAISAHVETLFDDLYSHLLDLVIVVQQAEDPTLTDDEYEALQKQGRYNFYFVKDIILRILDKKIVYGCLTSNEENQEEILMGLGADVQTQYKWHKERKKLFDYSGMLTLRRSNERYNSDPKSRCSKIEENNPILIQVYPTNVPDGKPGYGVHIKGKNISNGLKEEFSYYFVKYQDYNHKETCYRVLKRALDKLFLNAPIEDDKDEEENKDG